jgi:elongation factor P--(R)-beta-lysine ligase
MTPPAPAGRAAVLALRSRALWAARGFFHERGFVEVETPVRLPAPALEPHIDAIPSGRLHLRTSPELHMKRLLAEFGGGRLFQLGPCFRAGERGARHHPEFTMLEWYRAPGDAAAIMEDARALLIVAARAARGGTVVRRGGGALDLAAPWELIPVRDAFRRWAGWDPVERWDADRFDLDLVDRIEPALPNDRPVALTQYPAAAAALARLDPADPRMAERWELYAGGLELANAYTELTDAAEQRRRFEACAAERRAADRPVYPLDEPFLRAMDRGLPDCGGIALGMDRLVMLLAEAERLADVAAFLEE